MPCSYYIVKYLLHTNMIILKLKLEIYYPAVITSEICHFLLSYENFIFSAIISRFVRATPSDNSAGCNCELVFYELLITD